ncbi:MAG: hypothetical protein KAG37_06820 [Flavobacteriales bacterium]|nr:hypothetical protein [Flavobacteriales bacterium]
MKRLAFIFMIGLIPMLGFSQGCEEPSDDEGIKLFGFIQPQYNYIFDEAGTNNFDFVRARLGVIGVIPYDFSYYAVLEMSPKYSPNNSPYLLDAYVSYNRFNWAKAAIGQFKAPLSLELQTGCHKLLTINRSKTVLNFSAPMRDLGFMLSGGNDTTFVKYQLAIMNGMGLNNVDDNTAKDIVGRVVLQPLDFLHVGGSFRLGSNAPSDVAVTEDDKHTRYAAEIAMKFGELAFQAEYIYSKDEGSKIVGGGCGGGGEVVKGNFEGQGFYAMASYMFDFGLQPVLKFEMFDPDKNIDFELEEAYISTFGINYFFNDWTRLQINYCMINETAEKQIDNDRLAIQMQIKF